MTERVFSAAAPAKINLGLRVLHRREDGYHDIETVFLRIGWQDVLRAQPAETLSLEVRGADIPSDERNLCLKAALHLQQAVGLQTGAHMELEKHVPVGAGLGGGSSDAAATLRLLQHLWEIDVSDEKLRQWAGEVGADVPFFLLDIPAAHATGRGDVLRPLPQYRFPFHLVVVKPSCSVSTAEAYRHVRPAPARGASLEAIVQSNDLKYWREALQNDFESWAVEAYPEIRQVRALLQASGAGYVSLSGSGSALFGVFETERDAMEAYRMMKEQGYTVWQGGVR